MEEKLHKAIFVRVATHKKVKMLATKLGYSTMLDFLEVLMNKIEKLNAKQVEELLDK